jgi:hypothetical protein
MSPQTAADVGRDFPLLIWLAPRVGKSQTLAKPGTLSSKTKLFSSMHRSCLFRLSVPAIYSIFLEQSITALCTICSEYPDFFHTSELGGVALPKLRVEHPETTNKTNTSKKPHIHLAFII